MRGLRRQRKLAGITQAALAADLHVDRKTIVRWENGSAATLTSTLDDIAIILNCNPEDLVAAKPIIRAGEYPAQYASPTPAMPPAHMGQRAS